MITNPNYNGFHSVFYNMCIGKNDWSALRNHEGSWGVVEILRAL
jgi:hypothetical protein